MTGRRKMEIKKNVLTFAANMAYVTAKKAGNSASVFGMHQIKEPEMLKVCKKQ